MTDQHHGTDFKAGLTGLIVAIVVLFAIVFTIVKLTNNRYAGEHAAAEATR